MEAKDIDAEGVWHYDGMDVVLMGTHIPVPKSVRLRGEKEYQQVIMMVAASDYVSKCPGCESNELDNTIILLTPFAKMIPAHCCNMLIWMTDEREYDGSNDA